MGKKLRNTLLFLLAGVFPAHAQTSSVVRVNLSTAGVQANADSVCPQIAGTGTRVVFGSSASNLIDGTTNSIAGLYLRDTATGTTVRVDSDAAGTPANAVPSFGGCDFAVSANGVYVAFGSSAGNLGGSGGVADIYLKNVDTGAVELISVAQGGGASLGASSNPKVSADGRYVVFTSQASNLVAGDTNNFADVFLRDTLNDTTARVSVATDGSQASSFSGSPDISDDGRYVLFKSFASNLGGGGNGFSEGIYIRDTTLNTTTKLDLGTGSELLFGVDLSPAGDKVAFLAMGSSIVEGDTNGTVDAFVRDLTNGQTVRVTVNNRGKEGNGIAFLTGVNGGQTLSADGRFSVFGSFSTNLVPGDINGNFDVFVRDLVRSRTLVASTRGLCLLGDDITNETAEGGTISADGSRVAFLSISPDLVTGDTNGLRDVFVATMIPPQTVNNAIVTGNAPNPTTCKKKGSVTAPVFIKADGASARFNRFAGIRAGTTKYEFNIRRSGFSATKVSSENVGVFSKLAPGTYSARYRIVTPQRGGGTKPVTRYSKPARMLVKRGTFAGQ